MIWFFLKVHILSPFSKCALDALEDVCKWLETEGEVAVCMFTCFNVISAVFIAVICIYINLI